jgi:hypothetical protein
VLTILDDLPEGMLSAAAADLHRLLPGSALIHLPGRRARPLFVSVLLHGNEDTGLKSMQQVLSKYRGRELPRALSLFVGNVQAAALGVRRLEQQPDYNRVWPGAEGPPGIEHAMAQRVVDEMRARDVFASIDIHNNTGLNPHYACVRNLDRAFLHLATLFSRIVVHFRRPLGTQTGAFAEFCPAVTLECGKPGNAGGEQHAAEFVEAVMHLDHFPEHAVAKHDLDLYESVGTVKVPVGVSFTFGGGSADVSFDAELDRLNFRDLPVGTRLARVSPTCRRPLEVLDAEGRDIGGHYFEISRGELRTRMPAMAAMLTLDEEVIRQDCLCYLMERHQA